MNTHRHTKDSAINVLPSDELEKDFLQVPPTSVSPEKAPTLTNLDDGDHMAKHQAAHRFFNENLADESGLANGYDFAYYLQNSWGFRKDDPRFSKLYQSLMVDEYHYKTNLTLDDFIAIILKSDQMILLQRAFAGDLAVPEFPSFCSKVKEIFNDVYKTVPKTKGANAAYIPQLDKVNSDYWGLSICTIDGQRYDIGDSRVNFCVQSCVKPLTYCLALEEHGREKVLSHVGREPSGVAFNSLSLNSRERPHNPMINAGAIMSCSLIKNDYPLADRFDYVQSQLTRITGGFSWGFNNSVYLSEKATADSNFCLAYMMRKAKAFPEKFDLNESLEFYFQCCSLDTTCNKIAIAGATIANGGVCPLTKESVLDATTCRDVLSLMYSCGMYDYSGEWAFSIGIPAKSGVSGVIYGIIPGFGCICTYAPPLDDIGNSVRGVEFFKKLVDNFVLHSFDSVLHNDTRVNPLENRKVTDRFGKIGALYAAAEGDLNELRRLLRGDVSATVSDYDGRTLLHLAASEGHYKIVKYLIRHHVVDIQAKDRWDGTPYSDALKNGYEEIAAFIKKHEEEE